MRSFILAIALAASALLPASAQAMTKHECMQAGYGCQWSKTTGGRKDGWYFAKAKHSERKATAKAPKPSPVATWSALPASASAWPEEDERPAATSLPFEQMALLAYGARNFERHWKEAWKR